MITRDEVLKIARLSKFDLTEAEIEMYQKQLSDILGYVEQLNEVDTSNVDPTFQVTGLLGVSRPDQVSGSQAHFTDLLNVSELPKVSHQILVKKVL